MRSHAKRRMSVRRERVEFGKYIMAARTGSVPVSLSTGGTHDNGLVNKEARNKIMRNLDDTEAW